jgi:hypothetical protein
VHVITDGQVWKTIPPTVPLATISWLAALTVWPEPTDPDQPGNDLRLEY